MRLQQEIRRHYLLSALVPVLLVESILVTLYFLSTALISHQQADVLLDKAQADIRQLLNKQTDLISFQLQSVSLQLSLLQTHFKAFYSLPDQAVLNTLEPENLKQHENGAYFVAPTGNNCALYFSPPEAPDTSRIERVARMAHFDTSITQVIDMTPLVIQGYVCEKYLCRACPFIDDTPEVFGPQMDMSKENFYYLADQRHNPQRLNVWTEPYDDPAGSGWMVSVVAPIYAKDQFMGVGGLDITLTTLIERLLSNKLPWSMQALLLDKSGNILAIPDSLKTLLLNGESNDTWKRIQTDFWGQQQYQGAHQVGDDIYVVSSAVIQETGWRIVYITGRKSIFSQAEALKSTSWHLGFYAIAFLFVFYALFFAFSRHRANNLGRKIAHPIEALTLATQTLRVNPASAFELKSTTKGIFEIDELLNQFNQMSATLEARTQELVTTEAEKIVLERMSTTDQLTGLYNRHKGTELFVLEQKRGKRSNTSLGLILLDIDHFKQLNDTYGHGKGDEVLVSVAEILSHHARTLDHVVRWGGEEFLIICSNTEYSKLMQIADRFRQALETKHFSGVNRKVTASFGITQCLLDESLDNALERADKALYRAKREGRNQVVSCCS